MKRYIVHHKIFNEDETIAWGENIGYFNTLYKARKFARAKAKELGGIVYLLDTKDSSDEGWDNLIDYGNKGFIFKDY